FWRSRRQFRLSLLLDKRAIEDHGEERQINCSGRAMSAGSPAVLDRTVRGNQSIMLSTRQPLIQAIVLFAGAAVTPLWAQTFTKDVAPIFQKHCQSCHH